MTGLERRVKTLQPFSRKCRACSGMIRKLRIFILGIVILAAGSLSEIQSADIDQSIFARRQQLIEDGKLLRQEMVAILADSSKRPYNEVMPAIRAARDSGDKLHTTTLLKIAVKCTTIERWHGLTMEALHGADALSDVESELLQYVRQRKRNPILAQYSIRILARSPTTKLDKLLSSCFALIRSKFYRPLVDRKRRQLKELQAFRRFGAEIDSMFCTPAHAAQV